MSKNALMVFGSLFLLFILTVSPAAAAGQDSTEVVKSRTAIVLANFGTTVPSAVTAIVNIQDEVKQAFPGVPVKITFTSNIIRAVWRERQAESPKWLNQGIPSEILYVKNIIATVGELMEEGYRSIIVQPTHIFFMEQSHDLAAHVRALAGIRTVKAKWQPFDKIVMGRPALGMPGDLYSYHDDMQKALKTLAADVELARKEGAMLVYMGHGNEHWSSGIYAEAQKKMREMYPDVVTFIGAVEGFPGIDDLARDLSHFDGGQIVLKSFMIVAGDHAMNDMASDGPDSWKTILSAKGFSVEPVLEGLGSNDQFAQIFVAHIRDAARDNGIPLE
jgi:sirohydrochlorin cobaltochelatase